MRWCAERNPRQLLASTHGALTLDTAARRAFVDDALELSAREVALLEALLLSSGRVVSKDQLARSALRRQRRSRTQRHRGVRAPPAPQDRACGRGHPHHSGPRLPGREARAMPEFRRCARNLPGPGRDAAASRPGRCASGCSPGCSRLWCSGRWAAPGWRICSPCTSLPRPTTARCTPPILDIERQLIVVDSRPAIDLPPAAIQILEWNERGSRLLPGRYSLRADTSRVNAGCPRLRRLAPAGHTRYFDAQFANGTVRVAAAVVPLPRSDGTGRAGSGRDDRRTPIDHRTESCSPRCCPRAC